MSGQGFPFQADALALARWDYCEDPSVAPVISDPLSCALRTRQCGSHILATGDKRWAALAGTALAARQEPAVVTGWAGKGRCVDAAVPEGACSLMTSERYGPSLWETIGRSRVVDADARVLAALTGKPPPPPVEPRDIWMKPPVFGSDDWLRARF